MWLLLVGFVCLLRPLFRCICRCLHGFQLLLHLSQISLTLLLGRFQRSHLFGALLLLEVQHRQMFFVGAFLFPLDAVPLHHGSKPFFLGIDPLVQLGFPLGAACKAQGLQSLLQGDLGSSPFMQP